MKLWIIGKRGMLAQAFQRICSQKSIPFIATSKREVDLCDPFGLYAQFATLEFTHVINCSGYTAVDQAEQEQERAYALNVEGVKALAKLAAEKEKKLIHFSTDYVFDGESEAPYGEQAHTRPLSIYGKTKEEGEKALFELFPDALLIRTSWLFGKEGNHFVEKMVDLMQKRDSLDIVSDQQGRPTYCDDLVEATLDLLGAKGIFHFANRDAVSWFEWAEEIRKKLEEKQFPVLCRELKPIPATEYQAAAVRPSYSVLGTGKYEKAVQKTPRSWKEGLAECLKEYHVTHTC